MGECGDHNGGTGGANWGLIQKADIFPSHPHWDMVIEESRSHDGSISFNSLKGNMFLVCNGKNSIF